MPNSELVQSLLKGLDLLQLISTHPDGKRLNELVSETGIKKPTLHNLLRTLCTREFLVKDSMNRFHIGPAALEIADNQRSAARRTRQIKQFIELEKQFPHGVLTLTRLMSSEVRCLFRISPDRPGELQRPVDTKFMPYVSVSAIVLQAENAQDSKQLEEEYPFDEFGIGMWGSEQNFNEAKEKALRQKYFLRETEKLISIAFPMPESFALGFSFQRETRFDIDKVKEAAAGYRREVWGE